MTGPVIPFTPSPRQEYAQLSADHESLTAYIEREGPEMRATGQGDALDELHRLNDALALRLDELRTVLKVGEL